MPNWGKTLVVIQKGQKSQDALIVGRDDQHTKMYPKVPRKQPTMTSKLENLADQIAKLFRNHPSRPPINGELKSGRRAKLGVKSQNMAN
jgi:hypothetical protein